jgi:hypothetical protein
MCYMRKCAIAMLYAICYMLYAICVNMCDTCGNVVYSAPLTRYPILLYPEPLLCCSAPHYPLLCSYTLLDSAILCSYTLLSCSTAPLPCTLLHCSAVLCSVTRLLYSSALFSTLPCPNTKYTTQLCLPTLLCPHISHLTSHISQLYKPWSTLYRPRETIHLRLMLLWSYTYALETIPAYLTAYSLQSQSSYTIIPSYHHTGIGALSD